MDALGHVLPVLLPVPLPHPRLPDVGLTRVAPSPAQALVVVGRDAEKDLPHPVDFVVGKLLEARGLLLLRL